jgi:amino acid transporter
MLSASMLGDYSTSASSTPSYFPSRADMLVNPFLITSLLDLPSSLLFWIIILAILPATMLGYYSMSASLMPSEFFHRRFDLLEVCFL